jgi:hypothetical protein
LFRRAGKGNSQKQKNKAKSHLSLFDFMIALAKVQNKYDITKEKTRKVFLCPKQYV